MAEIIDWPEALRPTSVEWSLAVPQMMARSAFDGSTQAQTQGPPRWHFSITIGARKADELPQWEALVQRLRGRVNRVRCWDWRRELPLGPATGAPTVRVAAAGAVLAVQGFAPSVAGILLPGCYVGVNGELKRVSLPVNSLANGHADIAFEPPLRSAPPVGTPLVLTKPKALFVLTTDMPAFVQDGARHRGGALSFEEVFA